MNQPGSTNPSGPAGGDTLQSLGQAAATPVPAGGNASGSTTNDPSLSLPASLELPGAGDTMAGKGTPFSEAIAAMQLGELNQRVRMHATRLWQLPFAYFGLVVLLLSNLDKLKGDMPAMATVFLSTIGLIVLWCMFGAYEGVCRGSREIGLLEQRLGLRKTVGVQPDWLESIALRFFKRVTWHFLPYFLLTLASLAAVASLPFLAMGNKAEADPPKKTGGGGAGPPAASAATLNARAPAFAASSAPSAAADRSRR